jgi:4-diphosphocytidyl-2-C-methyl-D-erythritol kinase
VPTAAEGLRAFAPAKINLFLHVGDQRADGFHDLESLAVFARVGDELRFERASALSLTVTGPFATKLDGENDNLVLRAARAIAAEAGIEAPAKITLVKNLPVASGIGGGSADAAATLRGLDELWNLGLSQEALFDIAARLGSDVPVCVASEPAWMEGRGERVMLLGDVARLPMVLANPGVAVPTGKVFAALTGRRGVGLEPPETLDDARGLLAFLETTTNDLEAPAKALVPVIGDVLETLRALPGALLSRMSGSGATCFALFAEPLEAERAAATLAERFPGWWVKATRIGGA